MYFNINKRWCEVHPNIYYRTSFLAKVTTKCYFSGWLPNCVACLRPIAYNVNMRRITIVGSITVVKRLYFAIEYLAARN